MKLLVVVLLLVACGDNLAGDLPRGGSRLKLVWYVYEGGARELERAFYFDTQLQTQCTPRDWSDGHRYCAPDADEALYISDTCTRALGRTTIGAEPRPFFATEYVLPDVQKPSRVFRRGKVTSAPVVVWRRGVNGCMGPYPPGDDFEWFELGDEIIVDQLARIVTGTQSMTGALSIELDTSDDGLRVPVGLVDDSGPCTTIDRPNASTLACGPDNALVAAYYHDAACTQPALATDVLGVHQYNAKQFEVATSCWTYYAISDELSAPTLYEIVGGSCILVAPPGGKRFYALGAAAVPVLDRVRHATSARIRAIDRVNGELRVADPWLYDAVLDNDCKHDAELRCAPVTEIEVREFFSDAGCSTVIELAEVPMGECDPPARFARKDTSYRPLVAPYTGTIWVPSTGDTCSMYGPPAPKVAFTVGPAIDLATLPAAELQIDN